MKIYNENKTQILEDVDYSKGTLKEDVLITHIDKVEAVEEVGHYETIKVYDNGGKDVEWIVDVEKVDGVEEHDEEEQIYVYVPFTEEELKKMENERLILQYKQELDDTDYKAIKYAEGVMSEEEYAPIKKHREELRKKIRELTDV